MGIAVFPAAGGGVTPKVQEFTSTGTFVTPSNVSMVEVFLVGGGGGGGGAYTGGSTRNGGGGGGGQVIQWRKLPVTPGASYTVTIGSGGAGSTLDALGADGGDSSFGSLLTAFGGGGGGIQNSADSSIMPRIRATSGGEASTSTAYGGGGANPVFGYSADFQPGAISGVIRAPLNFRIFSSINGTLSGSFAVPNNNSTGGLPGYGIEGFGGGGMGGTGAYASTETGWNNVSNSGGGVGGRGGSPSTSQNGGNAAANRGGGGGGGARNAGGANATGGNGGSGYALVVYWS